MNFVMLPERKQDELIDSFRRFLNSLSGEVRIIAVKTAKTVSIGGAPFETVYYRFFVESLGGPIDHLLDGQGFKYQPVTEVPNVNPVKVFSKHIAMPGGRLMRTYTVYRLPASLVEGFISETYGLAERIVICIRPLPPEEATTRMGKYMRLLKSIIYADQSKGKTVREDIALKYMMAEETHNSLMAGTTRLFEFKVNVSVAGKNREELLENSKRLKETLQARLVRLDSPAFIQLEMASGQEGKRLIVDTGTASTFFPFISADIIESPGGIFLGVNRLTGAPVIFDPWLRMNQNLLIVGKSGSGKCVSGDTLVVDPETGALLSIRDMVKCQNKKILTLGRDYKLRAQKPVAHYDRGVQRVYEVVTRTGRRIKVTKTHPFLTINGWKPCCELKKGDRIATPRIIPVFGHHDIPDYQAEALAYALSDCCTRGTIKFVNQNDEIVKRFVNAVTRFPHTMVRVVRKGKKIEVNAVAYRRPYRSKKKIGANLAELRREYEIDKYIRKTRDLRKTEIQEELYRKGLTLHQIAGLFRDTRQAVSYRLKKIGVLTPHQRKSGVRRWLEEIGVQGKGSLEKEIPSFVFQLKKEKIALFLNRLFSCDGWACVCKNGKISIGYSSSSKKMAEQLQHLLLRFGILTRLRKRRTKKKPSYTVEVQGGVDMVKKFIVEIREFSGGSFDAIKEICERRKCNPNIDTIPRDIWKYVMKIKKEMQKTWVEVGHFCGCKTPKGFCSILKHSPSRKTMKRIATVWGSSELLNLAKSDLFWDEVVSVTYKGRERVYDLAVNSTHNFVANDIIVHNSFLSKIILSRLAQKNKDLAFYIIDPENEYGSVGRLLGAEVVDVKPERPLGLDPVQIFADSRDSAASILSDIAKVPAGRLHSTLRMVVGRSRNIYEVYERSPPDIKNYLESLVKGPDSFLVDGEPSHFSSRMVFNLKQLHREFELSPERSITLQAASILIFSKIWNILEDTAFLPMQNPKLILVDEVWLYCISPDTLLPLNDGRILTAEELFEEVLEGGNPKLLSLGSDMHIGPRRVVAAYELKASCIQVELRNNWSITVSENTALLVMGRDGHMAWKRAGKLTPGDYVAIACHLPGVCRAPNGGPGEKSLYAAGLVFGDGGIYADRKTGRNHVYFTNEDLTLHECFIDGVEEVVGYRVKPYKPVNRTRCTWVSRKSFVEFILGLGMPVGHKDGIHLGDQVNTLPNDKLRSFLRGLFDSDGTLNLESRPCISLASSSTRLIEEVKLLLLRFGIYSSIYVHRYQNSGKRGWKAVYHLRISGDSALKFLDKIGFYKEEKRRKSKRLREILTNTSLDTIPYSGQLIQRIRLAHKVSRKRVGFIAREEQGYANFRKKTLLRVVGRLEEFGVTDPYLGYLRKLATSDIRFVKVKYVKPAGVTKVYDFTVEGDHNFLGNGFIVHNTSMPASARFLEGVSRRGRKRNLVFSLNTQRVADVLQGVGGKALVENCATKVLLRQDEAAINLVGKTFGLSEAEKEAVLEFQPGQGILVAENVHIPVNFLATKDEYALFTTKPTERMRF